MAGRYLLLLALMLAPAALAVESRESVTALANPIRKVVTMLQSMQAKVEEEGEKEKALFDKYMCYCKTAGGDLSASIADAGSSISELGNKIKAGKEQKAVLAEELKTAQSDRTAAKKAMAEATAVREKEAAAFATEKANAEKDVAAVAKAVAAIESGMAGSFLQSSGAQLLRTILVAKQDLLMDDDRQDMLSFLSGSQKSEYAPQSGQILGILKQMHDEMAKNAADAKEAEEEAIKTYDQLMAAKKKEADALTAEIEKKLERSGNLGVQIAQMKNDMGDTEEALAADQEFLANMEKNCETKKKEWDVIVKTRGEELAALADTIKILNDDDALELFKKTLPSASSLMQLQVSALATKRRALTVLKDFMKEQPSHDHVAFIALALEGKKVGFDKVIKMIDDMIITLKIEQKDDQAKKEYCAKELDASDDKKKGLERAISNLETEIENAKEDIAKLAEEIDVLKAAIKELDKNVMEATEQRKEENEDFKDLMASDTAAKELMKFAKNRLNKFYNPKLYKAAALISLAPEDKTKGQEAFAQVSQHSHMEAPPPPPESFGAYSKKSEDSMGVMAMIDLLIADLDKEMTVAETDEKDGQADYETMMKDSATKRTTDSKALTEKGSAKADTQTMRL
jgi:predicted  nucleic acid-binding Zn-ribbon protein